jgi:hypothetical protein
MANLDAAFGLRPVRHYRGGEVRANEYFIEGGLAANIFRGDPVKSTGTTKRITVAAAGDTMLGVFDGCVYEDPQGNVVYSHYWPTGQSVKSGSVVRAWVFDDPDILFEVQADGAFTAGDIGATADLVAGTGNTMTGMSKFELESAGIGSDAGVKIVDVVRDGANEIGTNARVLVLLNEHELRSGTMTGV